MAQANGSKHKPGEVTALQVQQTNTPPDTSGGNDGGA